MPQQPIILDSLPASDWAISAIQDCFSQEQIDLRDVNLLIRQDPVLLANFMQKVNIIFTEKNRPVVNTLSSAINLLGIEQLKEILLSIESIKNHQFSSEKVMLCELIRDRITMAAHVTEYWAEYMGEQAIEELFCASMHTGLNEISYSVCADDKNESINYDIDFDNVDTVMSLYHFEEQCINRLPDSIQQFHRHSTISNRLKLSILVYQLLSSIERGYSTPGFHEKLSQVSEFIGISEYRTSYDTARCMVRIDKESMYKTFHFSQFLLSMNTEELAPLSNYCH